MTIPPDLAEALAKHYRTCTMLPGQCQETLDRQDAICTNEKAGIGATPAPVVAKQEGWPTWFVAVAVVTAGIVAGSAGIYFGLTIQR